MTSARLQTVLRVVEDAERAVGLATEPGSAGGDDLMRACLGEAAGVVLAVRDRLGLALDTPGAWEALQRDNPELAAVGRLRVAAEAVWRSAATAKSDPTDLASDLRRAIGDFRTAVAGSLGAPEVRVPPTVKTSPPPMPNERAIQCYRLKVFRGLTQEQVARQVYGPDGKQYQASRDINRVGAWIRAGNVLPDLDGPKPRTVTVDPAKLDRGPRKDRGRVTRK